MHDKARLEWVDAGLYPNLSPTTSSTTTSTSVNTPAGDRVRDWYCGLHSHDLSCKDIITDPRTKKVVDVVVSFEIINYILDLFLIFWF